MAEARPPVIDLTDFSGRKDVIIDQLMDAAKSLGFFYVTNHGISQDLIDSAFSQATSFFNLPDDYKNAIESVDWGEAKVIGYERNMLKEGQKERLVHESILHQYECHPGMAAVWPKEDLMPGYKKVTTDLMAACHKLASLLLQCFATGIGFPEDFFEKKIRVDTEENRTFLQYHKYPSTEDIKYKPGSLRYTAHTDESILTLLFPSPGSVGLEVASGYEELADGRSMDTLKDGYLKIDKWMQFPQKEGCIIINLGDPLQMWSDGLLRSNFHRVRMPFDNEPKSDRYSIGYFCWPLMDQKIEGKEGKYKAQTMREFMAYKGQMYAAAFSRDADVLQGVQDVVMGFPEQRSKAVELKA